MIWTETPGDRISAALSCCGHYVISHRPNQFTVSYRPPGEHHHIGTGKTIEEAKELAKQQAIKRGPTAGPEPSSSSPPPLTYAICESLAPNAKGMIALPKSHRDVPYETLERWSRLARQSGNEKLMMALFGAMSRLKARESGKGLLSK